MTDTNPTAHQHQAQRTAELEAERDRLAHDHHQVRADAQARVDAAVLRALAAERERDTTRGAVRELEAKVFSQEQALNVLRGCVNRHQRDAADPPGYLQDAVIRAAGLGALHTERDAAIKERDELRARLAELDRQEPVAFRERITGRLAAEGDEHRDRFPMAYAPLYARPVPAIPAGWLPIETAPKDKTRVLLKWPGDRPPCVGAWCSDRFAKEPAPHWSGDTDRTYGLRETRKLQPTHWMPIPAAPEAAR
jgi:hypothetical protein